MTANYFSFVETEVFRKQVDRTGSLDILYKIQIELIADPERGPTIQGTNGARKARIGKDGKGKSGGYRYIYLYLERAEVVYLLLLYGKDEQADLTPAQKKQVAEVVRSIKESYKK